MRFVVTPSPVSDETLFDRLKFERPNQPSNISNQTTFNAIKSVPVSQVAIGPRHIALLLEDGRVCRAAYQVLPERLDLNYITTNQSNTQLSLSHNSGNSGNHNSSVAGNHPSHSSQQHSSHHHHHHHHHHQPQQQNPVPTNVQVTSITKSSLSNVRLAGPPSHVGASVMTSGGMPTNLENRSSGQTPMGVGGSGMNSAGQSNVSASNVPPFAGRVNIPPQVGGLSVQNRQVARRGRMLRQVNTRGRATSVIMGSRAGLIVSPQYVPEDLINQAQVVLQGKPRSAIVRELQRTNLDVNSAVNNLLSSDNEDPEDIDESQDYLPNEDLMSLLDSNVSLPSGPTSVLIDAETVFPEDVFNSYSATRIRPTTIRHSVSSGSQSDRESSLASELEIRRMASRDASQSRRWLEHALRDPPNSDSGSGRISSATPTDFTLHQKNDPNQCSNRKNTSNSPELSPIQVSESVEIWPTSNDRKFVQISCMHSELIAISNTGQIHQWKWSEPLPFDGLRYGDVIVYHPKVPQLNLSHEKIQLLSASCVRATIVTESSKVATWIDDSISIVAGKLEHCAQGYPEFQKGDKISQLHTCSLYSCVRLESGTMYWWGVAPFSQRKKNWKKIQSKTCKHSSSGSGGSAGEISVGSLVCLRNGPSFGDGAIGFTTKDGVPKVGRLVMSAWNITDTCTFKIIKTSERKTQLSQSHQTGHDTKILPNSSNTNSTSTIATATRARKMLGQPLDFSGNVQEDQAPQSPGISKNSSSERLEMPPPPSPASSTCSEPGCSPSHKRKKHLNLVKDEEKYKDEEQWNLKDVIFLEEVKKPPVAKVIKLDGNTALVRFNQRDPFGQQSDADVNAYLQDCRMIRKDELQLARETTSSCRIIDYQKSPKKLNVSDSGNFLTYTVSNNGVHALVMNGSRVEYKMYQLASGKISKSFLFPTDTNALLGRDLSLITLYACGENEVIVTLRDGNGSLYPLSKDYLDSLKEPQPLDMAPVQALGMAIHPLRDPNNSNRVIPTLVMAMALEKQILIPAVLRSDPEFVRLTLASLEKEPVSQQIVASEKIDLNRNILHAAAYSCAPTPSHNAGASEKNKMFENESYDAYQPSSSGNYSAKSNYNEAMAKRHRGSVSNSNVRNSPQVNIAASSTLNLSADNETQSKTTTEENQTPCLDTTNLDWSNSLFSKFDIDPSEQKQAAHLVLMILIESPVLKPYLKDLMIQKDAHGMTPFMSAVSHRAYTAAVMLMDLAHWLVNQDENNDQAQQHRLFNLMLFPPGTHLDNNPLFMLCANDTCSFTWTGAAHITQDIFECRTCGLTRNLCCCTECARTCHKGHDCRLKNSSPTAYCDCWEKCKCKSLVAGSQQMRYRLLERLLADTDLVTYPDSRGEMILLFLVQTVGRQMVEQRQYGHERSPRHRRDDMPDHDLSPPRFARKALHKMLSEWLAIKSVIMAGTGTSQNLANVSRPGSVLNAEEHIFLSSQQGTAILDRFTHSVLIKIGPEMLDVLLTTIIEESSSVIPSRVNEARLVAKRFVRSVARNGVVLSVELSPVNYSRPANIMDWFRERDPNSMNTLSYHPWKLSPPPGSILQRCRKVFQALLPIAAEELAEIAEALISPVRLGVPRPTAPFSLVNSMAEATQASEEIFAVDPVVLPRASSNIDNIETRPPNLQSTPSTSEIESRNIDNNEPPVLSENTDPSADAIRSMLSENEMAIDAIDSEDAEASNNTFRPSNNGESDSDSDSNPDDASFQSNIDPSGPRSTATGATVGSEVGTSTVAYFSEAESGDSSNADEDDEESEANDTEQDTDELAFTHEDHFPFSRRNANHPSNPDGLNQQQSLSRSTNLGQQLHWALRHRDHSLYGTSQSSNAPFQTTAARLATTIGLSNPYTYLDGAPARRSVITNNSQPNNMSSTNCEFSMYTTAVGLSRAFSIIIRSISDLIPILKETERSNSAFTMNQLRVSPSEAANIIANLEKKMTPVWEWLFKVMDSTEGQLRFGCALTNGVQAASQSSHPTQNPHNYRSANFQMPFGNTASSSVSVGTSSYFPGGHGNPNILPVHPSMLARVNANLSAQSLNRRVPNLLEETATRVHQANSVLTTTSRALDGSVEAGVRLHNPISGQNTVSGRPQTLTRSNLSSLRLLPEPSDGPNELARRDFLSYMISLIRGHGNEHHDSLPILDVSSLRHVAYVFDAYIYFLQSLNRVKAPKHTDNPTSDYDDDTLPLSSTNQNRSGAKHPFFRRSESTLFLDDTVPDPFNSPLSEALPLAEQPHLLQPNARREDLFGIPKRNDVNLDSLPLQLSLTSSNSSCPKCNTAVKSSTNQATTTMHTSASSPNLSKLEAKSQATCCALHSPNDPKGRGDEWRYTALLGRWRLTVELFGREFLDDVGAEPGSILVDLVGFPLKENRFRKEMERLRNDSAPKEISLINVERDPHILIRQTIRDLNSTYNNLERSQTRRNHDLPTLACSKVKVSFKDEKGEGNGVARSFYTAFCEAILADGTLFYQPGLRNFYSPCQGDPTTERLNAFRNVGRVIGICLSQSEICPIQLNRHVIKYILRRPIAWHDLAFFDPVLYESLRQLIVDAEQNHHDSSQSTLSSLDLRFCVDLCIEEGGGQVELAPGGRNIEVTSTNVYEYVRRYALKRMLKSQEKALQAIRMGVMDVLPTNTLDNLTAEDFRLLLNGVGEINVQTLIGYTTFIDDRGTSAGKRNSVQIDEQLGYFKKWFWSIVEKMTTKERQDLVYFWTGSPALPASDEGFQPMPTVSIRPAEDLHLPTSNVCIFRLYIPLYSSKAILKNKLLIAIKEKNFGFI